MYDLILNYTNKKGKQIEKKYNLITDFCDNDMEVKILELSHKGFILATFFEKDYRKECFTSAAELKEHCNQLFH